MKKGYVNWKLVLVLVLGVCAVGATVVGLRKFNRTQRAEQGLKQGLQAYEDKRWREAASGLGQYLGVHPSDVEILLKYGHAQAHIRPFQRDHYHQAVNAYRAVLRFDGENLDAVRSLVDLYLQARVPGEAELIASRFLEKAFDGQLTLRLAAAQIMQRKYEEAAGLLTELLAREPSEAAVYELLANIASERPELLDNTPREWIDLAVANNPQDARSHILRGRFLTAAGQPDQAIENLRQAGRCDLSDVDSRLALAAAWLRLGAIEQAEEQLDIIYMEDPKLPELWHLRAIAASQGDDPAKASRIASEGLEHLDENGTDLFFLPFAVELYLQAGDNEGARVAMQKLRNTESDGGLVNYLDGLLGERDGDWPRAMARWREAIVQGYTSEPVYLKLAEGAMRLEDRTSAVETLRRYIHQNPNSFSAQLMLAHILSELRQWSDVSYYAGAAVRLNPESKDAQSVLARARIELLAGQPRSEESVVRMLSELIAHDDSPQNYLLAFRIAISRQDWNNAQQTLDALRERHGPSKQLHLAQGEYYMRRGQNEQAAAILDEAIRQYPDASEPPLLRSSLYVEQKDVPRAITFLQDAAARLDGPNQRRVQLGLADLYLQTGRTDDAVALFTAMADQNPRDILPRRRLLALSRSDGETLKLQQWIEEIKQIEGEAGRLWKIEQVSLWMVRDDIERHYSQAVTLLNENLSANPDDKQSLMLLAAAHEQVGNMRLAISLYRDMLARHPDDIDLAIAAMGAMYRAEEFRQAERLLADLLATGHADPRLAQLELQSHIRQGRLDSAENLLEKMVLQNAGDSSARLSLAMLRTRSGQFDAAKELIDELISEDPDAVIPHAVLADWHLRQDQPEKALAVCDAYLRRHDTAQAFRLRSQVLLALNETEKALEAIENILERSAYDPDMLLDVSALYASANFQEKALEAARRALALEPDSFAAQKQTAILLLASSRSRQEGMDLLEKALARQPRDAQLRLQKASLLLGRGAAAAAEGVQMLNALVNEYPRIEPAWGYLIEWYLLNNQSGMAMDMVLRGLAAIPDSQMLMMSKARVESLRSPLVALETLNQLARKYPDDEAVTEMQVRMMQRAGRTGHAVKFLSDWMATNPDSQSASLELLLMELLYENNDIPQAEQRYGRFSEDPEITASAMLRWIGLIAGASDEEQIFTVFRRWYETNSQGGPMALQVLQVLLAEQSPQAVNAAGKILSLVESREPDSPEVAYGKAMLRHMTGQKLEAVPFYERAVQLQPDNVVAVNNLAWILSQDKGEHARALELADRGLAMAPDYIDLIDTRGAIHFAMGNYDKAADDFRVAADRYLDRQPHKAVSTYFYAMCLKRLGRDQQAMAEFYRAREIDERTGGLTSDQRGELADILR